MLQVGEAYKRCRAAERNAALEFRARIVAEKRADGLQAELAAVQANALATGAAAGPSEQRAAAAAADAGNMAGNCVLKLKAARRQIVEQQSVSKNVPA